MENNIIEKIRKDLLQLEIWDADEQMDIEYVKSSPLYLLLIDMYIADKEIVFYLLYNVSQRVIPSWEYNCNDTQLRPILYALKYFILNKISDNELLIFNKEIKSPKFDCTYSDTSGAAGTLFNSVRTIIEDNPLFATYAISDADIANTGAEFKEWLIQIAIPNSLNKQFCNCEQTMKGTYDVYESIYKNLFVEMNMIS